MHLATIRAGAMTDAGPVVYRVRSALAFPPPVGYVIRYGEELAVLVDSAELEVGIGGDLVVNGTVIRYSGSLEGALERLRFRREGQDADPAPAAP